MAKQNKIQVIAEQILSHVGGKENVSTVAHCVTRLRLTFQNSGKVNKTAVESINGVMGVIEQAGQFQIILGPGTVGKVATEVGKLTGLSIGQVDEAKIRKEELKAKNATPFKLFLRRLSNIFIPLIPAFIGCGIIYGFAKLFLNLELIDKNLYYMLYVIGKGVFLYMNIMVGMNTAKEFGGSPALGGTIAGILTTEKLAKITIAGETLVPGAGGIIAVLIACTFGAILEKRLRKVMPSVLDLILTPTIVLLVIGFASLYIFHPLGSFLSVKLTVAVTQAVEGGSILTGAVLSGTFLPFVMTGLHRVLTPVEVSLLNETGLDILRPILAMAGAGQVGAAIAVYMKTKSKRLKRIIGSSLPVGMLGIGEPLLFGVTLPLGKPFITACLGSMAGGAYIAFTKVASTGIGLSGLPLTLLIENGAVLNYLIGTLLAYGGGFLLTYFTKWEDYDDSTETDSDNPMNDIIKISA